MLLKGTHSGVDGVYTADPKLDPDATKLDEVTFMDVITEDLRVMDLDRHHPLQGERPADPWSSTSWSRATSAVRSAASAIGTLVR